MCLKSPRWSRFPSPDAWCHICKFCKLKIVFIPPFSPYIVGWWFVRKMHSAFRRDKDLGGRANGGKSQLVEEPTGGGANGRKSQLVEEPTGGRANDHRKHIMLETQIALSNFARLYYMLSDLGRARIRWVDHRILTIVYLVYGVRPRSNTAIQSCLGCSSLSDCLWIAIIRNSVFIGMELTSSWHTTNSLESSDFQKKTQTN